MYNETPNGQQDKQAENTSPKQANRSVFDAIPSKTSFFAGLIAGVMAFSTLGFGVLMFGSVDLSKLGLGSGASAWGKPAALANTNGNANTNANTPPADPGINLDKLPQVSDTDHVRGDLSKAKLVMIEYSDYECPFCKSFDQTMQQIVKDYGNDVAWIYRHFPLSFHQNAQKEAEAAECAAELGGNDAFWKFSDLIYARTTSNGTGFALDKLGPLAKEVGIDQVKFQSCLDSGKYAEKVQSDMAGGSAAGIDGTPGTILINKAGQADVITGAQALATVKSKIDALLK